MRELENKKALSEEEEEKVAGGHNNTLLENPSMDPVIEGQNNFGRPLPFPQDRRDLTDLPCDDPFYTKDAAPVEAPKKGRSL